MIALKGRGAIVIAIDAVVGRKKMGSWFLTLGTHSSKFGPCD